MRVRKAAVISVLCILFAVWCVRFAYLNINTEHPVIEVYQQGEYVEYDDNFFYRSSIEHRNGYSIKVVGAYLVPIKDYLESIGVSYDEYKTKVKETYSVEKEFVLDLHIVLKNEGNTDGNFDIFDTRVNASNFCLSSEGILFGYLYPNLSGEYSFKVRENTEYEIRIPYCPEKVDMQVCTFEYATSRDFYLNISQYPIKKMIKLQIKTNY